MPSWEVETKVWSDRHDGMNVISSPLDLSNSACLQDSRVFYSQHGAWCPSQPNKRVRGERGATFTRGRNHPAFLPFFRNPYASSKHQMTGFMLPSLDTGSTSSFQRILPLLLIVGWIVACIAVVYIVFILATVLNAAWGQRHSWMPKILNMTASFKCVSCSGDLTIKWINFTQTLQWVFMCGPIQ